MKVGLGLGGDLRDLTAYRRVLDEVQYVALSPAALWRAGADGGIEASPRRAEMLELEGRGLSFVATGLGLSLGTACRFDAARRRAWLDRLKVEQAAFDFSWYAEPLGATCLAGINLSVPMPIPLTGQFGRVVRGRLRAMQRVVPQVAVALTGSPMFAVSSALPLFVERVTRLRGMHLVLDVEALRRWPGELAGLLDALPLQRVIELRTRAVEPALAPLIAGCSNLRGITLALDDDVAALAGRIRRVRSMLRLSSMVEACVV